MNTSLRAGLAGALACGVLVTAMSAGRDGGGGGDASAPPTGPYVALGDSYTAGPGIPDRSGTPAGCERSGRNYPALVAARLKIEASDFHDVSCTGATIADLSAPQPTDDGTNPAQFDALSRTTRLVTVGIGGNDIGFASVIRRCVTSGVLYEVTGGRDGDGDAPCEERYVSGDVDEVRRKIEAADGRLARALDEVERRAPKARVYVVGYPAILPSDGGDCGDCGRDLPLTPGDFDFVRDKERELNTVLRQRAEAARARYVDTYGPSEGHDACSAEDTRWIEPLVPRSPAAAVHPDERGGRGMADAVLHALAAHP
ncbi:SGNH/GDSL hydrolase family protein [Streptomyces europaeiscabiei]|uniref:SGNH/GDSL hydrolase family protein n=1 Tax=Streptomyces europaeiscabiei TaxID=146819 RepID=UPI000765F697|nr:SGNH/GDSL hydrolase family protein [Streptomyces europaeiscabiei]MDX3666930.1 SGNH/GDSL hydrolase family protein [Streptomyces europaeiscabiei]